MSRPVYPSEDIVSLSTLRVLSDIAHRVVGQSA